MASFFTPYRVTRSNVAEPTRGSGYPAEGSCKPCRPRRGRSTLGGISHGSGPRNRTGQALRRSPSVAGGSKRDGDGVWRREALHFVSSGAVSRSSQQTARLPICTPKRELAGPWISRRQQRSASSNEPGTVLTDQMAAQDWARESRCAGQHVEPSQRAQYNLADDAAAPHTLALTFEHRKIRVAICLEHANRNCTKIRTELFTINASKVWVCLIGDDQDARIFSGKTNIGVFKVQHKSHPPKMNAEECRKGSWIDCFGRACPKILYIQIDKSNFEIPLHSLFVVVLKHR